MSITKESLIKEAKEMIEYAQDRLDRLEAGEELAQFWDGRGVITIYCGGCGNWKSEVTDPINIPFKKDAICASCRIEAEESESGED